MKDSKLETVFNTRLQSLNEKQREVVETIDGPVLVVAGPGSGKTEILSLRVANILRTTDALPQHILLLTFTEVGAHNMRERLVGLIGPAAYRVRIYTFHAFASDIINRYPALFFNGAKFQVANDIARYGILESIFKSLSHTNPLSSFHGEQGFTYLSDVLNRISHVKKGGLTPDEWKKELDCLQKEYKPINTLFKKYIPPRIPKVSEALETFGTLQGKLAALAENTTARYLASTLQSALANVGDTGKTSAITEWKNAHASKDKEGIFVLSESTTETKEKLSATAEAYDLYQKELYRLGLYDYDDMILEVLTALRKNDSLRADLEEQYQYILIDEFQDTNDAQLKLVQELSSSPVNEGRPNVCAVGDDDQAVYKFQGAEISNIYSFKSMYKDVKLIVLTENYRSTQKILDYAREVVLQGVDRLESKDKSISKAIISANKQLPEGEIVTKRFSQDLFEYAYVAEKIAELIGKGIAPQNFAVLAKKHALLQSFVPYLDTAKVSYAYEKRENVFEKPHVHQLITMCIYLASAGSGAATRDDLLPEILSYPFWGLERIHVWEVAEYAKKNHVRWLEAILKSPNSTVREIGAFLTKQSIEAQHLPLPLVLDILIGSHVVLEKENEDDDIIESPFEDAIKNDGFVSPFRSYYFGQEHFEKDTVKYLDFLFALRTFVGALREYKQGEILHVHDVEPFVATHTDNNIILSAISPFASSEHAVQLMSAHKAKGLEFEYVFIIGASHDIWAPSASRNKIKLPLTMSLGPAGDTSDDSMRLLYVAMTRAKHTLYITHSDMITEFLANHEVEIEETRGELAETIALKHGYIVYGPPFVTNEKATLSRLLEGYQMPVTHLNNFLNFNQVGPERFIEQNLLRFPQAIKGSSLYGSAMHAAAEFIFTDAKVNGDMPAFKKVLEKFNQTLEAGRLEQIEYTKFLKRGEAALKTYYEYLSKNIDLTDKVEFDFKHEEVVLGDARLTGKIDKVHIEGKFVTVTDLKTGEAFDTWEVKEQKDKIKLHGYLYQLAFYKLLVENSREFEGKKVEKGILEFVEPDNGEIIKLAHDLPSELVERVEKLAKIVYAKIMKFDFPDTSKYKKNSLQGLLDFEEDLLAESI